MQQSLKLAFAIVSIHTVTRRQRILTLSEATQTTSTLLHSPEPPPTTTGTYIGTDLHFHQFLKLIIRFGSSKNGNGHMMLFLGNRGIAAISLGKCAFLIKFALICMHPSI